MSPFEFGRKYCDNCCKGGARRVRIASPTQRACLRECPPGPVILLPRNIFADAIGVLPCMDQWFGTSCPRKMRRHTGGDVDGGGARTREIRGKALVLR